MRLFVFASICFTLLSSAAQAAKPDAPEDKARIGAAIYIAELCEQYKTKTGYYPLQDAVARSKDKIVYFPLYPIGLTSAVSDNTVNYFTLLGELQAELGKDVALPFDQYHYPSPSNFFVKQQGFGIIIPASAQWIDNNPARRTDKIYLTSDQPQDIFGPEFAKPMPNIAQLSSMTAKQKSDLKAAYDASRQERSLGNSKEYVAAMPTPANWFEPNYVDGMFAPKTHSIWHDEKGDWRGGDKFLLPMKESIRETMTPYIAAFVQRSKQEVAFDKRIQDNLFVVQNNCDVTSQPSLPTKQGRATVFLISCPVVRHYELTAFIYEPAVDLYISLVTPNPEEIETHRPDYAQALAGYAAFSPKVLENQ